jgi:hypothetical protein
MNRFNLLHFTNPQPLYAIKTKNFRYQMNQLIETSWKFVRKDISPKEFENWIYSNPHFESFFGKELYFQLISKNYNNKEELFVIKESLKKFLLKFEYQCACIKMPDNYIIGMGSDEDEYLNTFEEIKKRGNPFWWLYLSNCTVCNTYWLIAQEEKINDDYCLKRLDLDEVSEIINLNKWPNVFDHYENLLKLEKEFGHSVRFIDPLCSSLKETTFDLLNERPSITAIEISDLLNVEMEHAKILLEIAKNQKKP